MGHPIADTTQVITLTTTDADAVSGELDDFKDSQIRDIILQEINGNDAYVSWGTSTQTATAESVYLKASSTLNLYGVSFRYFSAIRKGGSDVKVRITGIGRLALPSVVKS